MEKKSLGTFLTVLRKANGMTQKDLADRLNVSDKAVSRWERNESCPDVTLIPVIADIFGVTSDELLRGERCDNADEADVTERTDKEIAHFMESIRLRFLVGMIAAIGVSAAALSAAIITADERSTKPYFGTVEGLDAWTQRVSVLDTIASAVSWACIFTAIAYAVIQFIKAQGKLSMIDRDDLTSDVNRKVRRIFLVGACCLGIIFFLNIALLLEL